MSDPSHGGDAEKRLEISKYPNRRYYDKTRSRHLTLEEIYAAIRDGFEVQVTDSKTGEDITAKVLAQIILELDPPKLGVFPVPLLHQLLRTNEQLITDFTQKYFSQALSAFLSSQKTAEQYLRQILGLQSSATGMTEWAKMMWGPFNPNLWTRPEQAPNGDAPAVDSAAEMRARIEQLQQQVSELTERLAQAPGQPRRGRNSGKASDASMTE